MEAFFPSLYILAFVGVGSFGQCRGVGENSASLSNELSARYGGVGGVFLLDSVQ